MILVDSSVWIDFFRGARTREADLLDTLLGKEPVVVGDLVLAEVLQGVRDEREFRRARKTLDAFEQIDLVGHDIALRAAQNFRKLRDLGITVRKTIDTLIATRCIADGHTLLHADRNFDAFALHLGLQVVHFESTP